MISQSCMCVHLHDVDMVVLQVAPQAMQVVCSEHLYVAWLLLIQHLHCKVRFGPCLRVAAPVTRLWLAWAG